MNTFLRMPQGGTTVPVFIDEKSKHRDTKFCRLRSHIFLWNNQEQNVPFESSASILNAIFLFLTAVVRKDMWAESEKEGKIRWQSQLGTYIGSKIYLTDRAGFFSSFQKLCLYTCCCEGLLPHLEHRWMLLPGPAVVHLHGGLAMLQV